MKVDKKQLIKTLAICLLGLVMFAGAGVLLVFDIAQKTTPQQKIMYGAISGVLSLLCIVTAALFIYMYYQQNIKPNKYSDDPKSDYDIKRESDTHKRLPGKDMYDVIRNYRKRNYRNRVIAILFCCVLVIAIALVKMTGENHIDYRISIGIGLLIVMISFGIAGKKEFSYSREIDFKKAIAESGVDPVRLNADFMIGSHFFMRDGLVVLGRDYMVIFAKSLCEVIEVDKIEKIVKDSFSSEMQGSKLITYRLKIILKNGYWFRFSLRDLKETELILNEFRLRALGYEDEGEKTMKEIKAERNK